MSSVRTAEVYGLLQEWAGMLGWKSLTIAEHRIDEQVIEGIEDNTVRWYYSGSSDDVMFQINEMPTWCAAVYAVRYRICTGWHEFVLQEDPEAMKREADRLKGLLHADWFLFPERRKQFRLLHPECSGYSWKRIREEGLPARTRVF